MTIDRKAVEQRIAELRADDAAMTEVPWIGGADSFGVETAGRYIPIGEIAEADRHEPNALGIVRTRNSLASTAEMLEELLAIVVAARDRADAECTCGAELGCFPDCAIVVTSDRLLTALTRVLP